jgi:hypothetical protein
MTPLTAANASGALALAVLAIVAVGAYLVACAAWPFSRCRWCDGRGFHLSPTGRHMRDCRHCKGTGRRVRIGRRLYICLAGRGQYMRDDRSHR